MELAELGDASKRLLPRVRGKGVVGPLIESILKLKSALQKEEESKSASIESARRKCEEYLLVLRQLNDLSHFVE
jgi:hypothetical protein